MQKALSEMIAPLACKNSLCPGGYSEEEKGLQQFRPRAATMTTDKYRNHLRLRLLKPAHGLLEAYLSFAKENIVVSRGDN